MSCGDTAPAQCFRALQCRSVALSCSRTRHFGTNLGTKIGTRYRWSDGAGRSPNLSTPRRPRASYRTTIVIVSSLSPADRAPDFAPGPRGPEDSQPGVRLSLTVDQVHDVERVVAQFPAATRVEIEERGAGHFEVTTYYKESVLLGQHRVFPLAFKPDAS